MRCLVRALAGAQPRWSDRLAIGGGPIVAVSVVSFDPAFFAPPNDASGDGLFSFPSGAHSRPFWGGGFRAGATYRITERLTAGFSFTSPVWFETWRFNARNEVGAPFQFSTQATLPMILSAGLAWCANDSIQLLADVRWLGRGGALEKVQETVEEAAEEAKREEPKPPAVGPPEPPTRVIVERDTSGGLWTLPGALAPWLAPLGGAALVAVLVPFMLYERQELRNRVIRALGYRRLTVTTRALDEAARRVSRYLLMQTVVNSTFGLLVAVGDRQPSDLKRLVLSHDPQQDLAAVRGPGHGTKGPDFLIAAIADARAGAVEADEVQLRRAPGVPDIGDLPAIRRYPG